MTTISPDLVDEGIWLGPQPLSPEDFAALGALGVTDVLSLMPEQEAHLFGVHPAVAFRVAGAHGMTMHRVGIEDFSHKALVAHLPRALEVLRGLRSRGRTVYVHCAAGRNRSPTLVAAYIAVLRGLTPEAACEEVCRLHPVSAPDVAAVRATLARRPSDD